MPELPEVETMRRGIIGVVGAMIVGVERTRCQLKPISITPRADAFRRRSVGSRISSVDRVGKRVVLRLDNGNSIVFEPRMTGLVLIAEPPNREHLRFRLRLSGVKPRQLLYWDRRGLGSVRLLSARQMQEYFGPEKLGPDALAVAADELRSRLCGSRRAIKVALLDQRVVAGIGNLYASEMLHAAGIYPNKRCDRLTRGDWQRLHTSMNDVLEEAIRYEGSTLSDGTYRNALNDPGGYQDCHRVYDREGQLCPSCGEGNVKRIVQSQRSTFYCPICQKTQGR
ncbi:MAG: bifunctional DNA-formamidopyrimidine glycosylase/DNA-(apurinic or apyrimidinic site) lyase [Planctomycetes bacterium]|nr:bifunctional DNA-formamidopyrimidine glycosylase/DNA-(apurinic or apyrimidinic site) lyase [Planctomycetota bacterium]